MSQYIFTCQNICSHKDLTCNLGWFQIRIKFRIVWEKKWNSFNGILFNLTRQLYSVKNKYRN